MEAHNQKPVAISMLCVVSDRGEPREKVLATLEQSKAFFKLGMLGKGTANSRILGYLGLGETDKVVTLTILPSHIAREVMDKLDEALQLGRPGHGIAFAARIQEGCYHTPIEFTGTEDGGSVVEVKAQNDLIMVVMNRGYTEEVMDVARKAGATGGTVLHARGLGLEGAEKFFGVTIQPEKEIIMIVASTDDSCGIMAAIADEVGPGSDANAVSFSLPLTAVRGIGRDVPKEIL